MSTKKKSRFWIITKNTVLFIMATVFIWIVFHLALTAHEQEKYPPLGQMVKVDGRHMHIYTKGDGKHTMVLLSGLGTAAPALDFEPLINELAINNKVVVVEPFGYGWSSLTNKERTVENIVEELRTALHQASIEGPYILMPHSISGIYSMYYANKYPEEVKAVIGIDPTLPQALQYFGESAPTMPQYMGYISLTGVSRLATYINPKNYLPIAEEGTYSEDNLTMTRAISAWKGYNKNVIDEINEIKNNVDKTAPLKFPRALPVLFFTTKEDRVNQDGKSKTAFYQTQLTKSSASKIIALEGQHYLHWTRSKEISQQVQEFTDALTDE